MSDFFFDLVYNTIYTLPASPPSTLSTVIPFNYSGLATDPNNQCSPLSCKVLWQIDSKGNVLTTGPNLSNSIPIAELNPNGTGTVSTQITLPTFTANPFAVVISMSIQVPLNAVAGLSSYYIQPTYSFVIQNPSNNSAYPVTFPFTVNNSKYQVIPPTADQLKYPSNQGFPSWFQATAGPVPTLDRVNPEDYDVNVNVPIKVTSPKVPNSTTYLGFGLQAYLNITTS